MAKETAQQRQELATFKVLIEFLMIGVPGQLLLHEKSDNNTPLRRLLAKDTRHLPTIDEATRILEEDIADVERMYASLTSYGNAVSTVASERVGQLGGLIAVQARLQEIRDQYDAKIRNTRFPTTTESM